MPIDDTPLEHVVVALATKWIGEPADEPEVGEVTFTVANAGMANIAMRTQRCFIRDSSYAQFAHTTAGPQKTAALVSNSGEKVAGTVDLHQLTFNEEK